MSSPWVLFASEAATILNGTPTCDVTECSVANNNRLDSVNLAPERILSLVAKANRAVIDATRNEPRPVVPRQHQLGAAIAYFHGHRVLEMLTGEGKTVVTLLITAVLVLCKEKVQIATSNALLSERDCNFMRTTLHAVGSPLVVAASDVQKSKPQSVTGGGDDHVNLLLDAKPGTVIFGTMHELMAFSLSGNVHVLQELMAGASAVIDGDVRPRPRREWCLLIDEIDFLVCNSMTKVTQLCMMTFGTDELFCLSAGLAVAAVRLQGDDDSRTVQVRRGLVLDSDRQIDQALHVFKTLSPRQAKMLQYTLPSRIDSVIEVIRDMDENVNFVINPERGIVAVSQESGLLEDNVVFGLGRDQILAVLYKQFVYGESVASRTLSVPTQFAALYKSIGGWTGTLGNDDNCAFITRIIERTTMTTTQWLRVPPSASPENRTKLPPQLTDSRAEHFEAIFRILRGAMPDGAHMEAEGSIRVRCGAALILFATIAIAESFHKYILESMGSEFHHEGWNASVCLITQNGVHAIPTEELSPGTIIITTMLMHRGEDLHLSDAVSRAGGLLEIDTFVGESDKTDTQKWGRVARYGHPGTVVQVIDRSTCPFAGSFTQSFDSIIELRDFGETLAQICNDGANLVNLSQVDLWNLRAQVAIKNKISSPSLAQEALDLWGFQMELFRSFETRLYYEQIMRVSFNDAANRLGLSIDLPITYPSHAIKLSALIDQMCRFPRNTTFLMITKAHLALGEAPSVEIDDTFLYQCSCFVGRPIVVFSYSGPGQRDRWSFDDLDEAEVVRCATEHGSSAEGLQNGLNARLYYCNCCRLNNVATAFQSREYDESSALHRSDRDEADGEPDDEAPVEVLLHPLYLFRLRSGDEMFRNGETVELHGFTTKGGDSSEGPGEGTAAPVHQQPPSQGTVPLMSCVFSMLYGDSHRCDFSCKTVPAHVPAAYGSVKPTCAAAEEMLCDFIVRRMECTRDSCGCYCIRSQLRHRNESDRARTQEEALQTRRDYMAKLGQCLADWNRKVTFVNYFTRCADHFIASLATSAEAANARPGRARGTSFLAPSPTQLLYYKESVETESFDVLYERSKKQFTCHLPQLHLVMLRHLGSLKKAEHNARVIECLNSFLKISEEMKKKWDYFLVVTQLPTDRNYDDDVRVIFHDDQLNPLELQLMWISDCCDALRQNASADLAEMTGTEKVKTKCASSASCDVLLGIVPPNVLDTVGAEIAGRIGCWATRVSCRKCRDASSVTIFCGLAVARVVVGTVLMYTGVGASAGSHLLSSAVNDLHSAYAGNGFVLRDYANSECYKIALSAVTMFTKVGFTSYMQGTKVKDAFKTVAGQLLQRQTTSIVGAAATVALNTATSSVVDSVCSYGVDFLHDLLQDYNLTERAMGIAADIHKPGMEKRRETVLKIHLLHRASTFRERLTNTLPQTCVSRVDAAAGKAFNSVVRCVKLDDAKRVNAERSRKGFLGAVASGLHDVVQERKSGYANSKAEIGATLALSLASTFNMWLSDLRSTAFAALDSATLDLQRDDWMTQDSENPETEKVKAFIIRNLQWSPAGQASEPAACEAVHLVHKILVSEGFLMEGLTRSAPRVGPDTNVFDLRSEISKCLRPFLPDRATTDRAVRKAVLFLKKIQDADRAAMCESLFQPLYNSVQTELDAYTFSELKSAASKKLGDAFKTAFVGQPAQDADMQPAETGRTNGELPGRTGRRASEKAKPEGKAQAESMPFETYPFEFSGKPLTPNDFARRLSAGDVGELNAVLYPLDLRRSLNAALSADQTRSVDRSLADAIALLNEQTYKTSNTDLYDLEVLLRGLQLPGNTITYRQPINSQYFPCGPSFDKYSATWATMYPQGSQVLELPLFPTRTEKSLRFIEERMGVDLFTTLSPLLSFEEQFAYLMRARRKPYRYEENDDTLLWDECRDDVVEATQDDNLSSAELQRAIEAEFERRKDQQEEPPADNPPEGQSSCLSESVSAPDHDEGDDPQPVPSEGLFARGATAVAGLIETIDSYDDQGAELVQQYIGVHVRPSEILSYSAMIATGAGAAIQFYRMGGKYAAKQFFFRAVTQYGKSKLNGACKRHARNAAVYCTCNVTGINEKDASTIMTGIDKAINVVSDIKDLKSGVANISQISKPAPDYRTGAAKERDGVKGLKRDGTLDKRYTRNVPDVDEGFKKHPYSQTLNLADNVLQHRATSPSPASATHTATHSVDHSDTTATHTGKNAPTAAAVHPTNRGSSALNRVDATGTGGDTCTQKSTERTARAQSVVHATTAQVLQTKATQAVSYSTPGVSFPMERAAVSPTTRPHRKAPVAVCATTSPEWQALCEGLSAYYVACVLLNLQFARTSQALYALDLGALHSLHERLALPHPVTVVEVLEHIHAEHAPQVFTYDHSGSNEAGVGLGFLRGDSGSEQSQSSGFIFVRRNDMNSDQEHLLLPGALNCGTQRYTFIMGAQHACGESNDTPPHGYALASDAPRAVLGLYKLNDTT